jgi:glutamate-1-semialdehyde 2,1-aminomutase
MQRKRDDHHASHHDRRNQALHLLSSSVFLACYGLLPSNLTLAMCMGLPALFVRQFGHAIFEPPCHDKEKLLLGFTTRSKTLVVAGYLLIPIFETFRAAPPRLEAVGEIVRAVAFDWFLMTLAVVFGHVLYLVLKHDLRSSMIWFVKLVTDPLTDLAAYSPRQLLRRR